MELTNFQTVFDPRAYLESRCNPTELTKNCAHFSCFVITSIHQFFVSHADQLLKASPISVIDYGCGPVIANVISAAEYASEIVLAEHTDSSRDCIQQWVDNNPSSFDWSHYFSYIVQQLEGKSQEEIAKREVTLRRLIKAIVPCDLTKDPLISPQYSGPYDILINIVVIDNSAINTQEFEKQMNSLSTLIKPGGYLLFLTPVMVESETDKDCCYDHYTINGQDFNMIIVSKAYLKSLLVKIGFEEINIIDDPNGPFFPLKILQFVSARKKLCTDK